MSKTPNILRLATFRHSLVAIPLNLVASLTVVAFIFVSAQSIANRRIDREITAEHARLIEDFAPVSMDAIPDAIRERITLERGSARLYKLVGPQGTIAANFAAAGIVPEIGATETTKVVRSSGQEVMARLSAFELDNGDTLVVGRDLTEQVALRLIVEETLGLAAAVAAIFSMVFGLMISRSVLHRLSTINTAVTEILHGNLEKRVQVVGGEDEFNNLSTNINSMLDRIVQLMDASREVTDNIAHDLRTPLNRIRGQLELALLPGVSREELEHTILSALDEADLMSETFEALLTIARLDNGIPSDFAQVDLPALADDLIDYFAPLAEEKSLQLGAGQLDPATIMADRHLLFQAVSNAVDNAIRYSGEGGKITISVRQEEGGAVFVVADNGPGIPENKRADVLRRFYRLDASRNQPGTGLGLSVVEAVARHHRGTLTLEDNNPGLLLSLRLPATHS